jgi:hypothetical protein
MVVVVVVVVSVVVSLVVLVLVVTMPFRRPNIIPPHLARIHLVVVVPHESDPSIFSTVSVIVDLWQK